MSKPLHEHFCTHLNNEEDRDILTRKIFDVNMRLFRVNPQYRDFVLAAATYIAWNSATEKEGYKKPHGFSAANAGIPFNIIAYQRNDNPKVMLNPKITRYYGEVIASESNCGSLTLAEPITIHRSEFIDVEYCNLHGDPVRLEGITRRQGGFTIQHEVDHNNGVLITYRTNPSAERSEQS